MNQTSFSFLGYEIKPEGLGVAAETIKKSVNKLQMLYEQQSSKKCLSQYIQRFTSWIKSGLNDDELKKSIIDYHKAIQNMYKQITLARFLRFTSVFVAYSPSRYKSCHSSMHRCHTVGGGGIPRLILPSFTPTPSYPSPFSTSSHICLFWGSVRTLSCHPVQRALLHLLPPFSPTRVFCPYIDLYLHRPPEDLYPLIGSYGSSPCACPLQSLFYWLGFSIRLVFRSSSSSSPLLFPYIFLFSILLGPSLLPCLWISDRSNGVHCLMVTILL
jgi:hypothetical protein